MANPAGEPVDGPLRLGFDRRLKLGFHGCGITTDAGLPACREPDGALGLTDMAGHEPVDPRTGKNGRHAMTGLFRRSVFGRLGGHEDVNDADRPGRDPAMRWIVGGRALAGQAACACRKGLIVGFITASAPVRELPEARDEKRLLRLLEAAHRIPAADHR